MGANSFRHAPGQGDEARLASCRPHGRPVKQKVLTQYSQYIHLSVAVLEQTLGHFPRRVGVRAPDGKNDDNPLCSRQFALIVQGGYEITDLPILSTRSKRQREDTILFGFSMRLSKFNIGDWNPRVAEFGVE